MKHPVRTNLWVAVAAVFALVALWIAGFSWLVVLIAVTLILFGVPQHYETRETDLIIRSGLSRRKVPYAKIEAIQWKGCDAAEEDQGIRLRVGRQTWIHFRPRDQKRFVDAIAGHVPHLNALDDVDSARS